MPTSNQRTRDQGTRDQVSHPGLTVWLTGLSSAGKTTITQSLDQTLRERGYRVEWLDGDVVRLALSKDLGFSKEDRDENIRRIGVLAGQLTESGAIVLVSAISPYRAARDEVRRRIGAFLEVWVHAPLAVCEQRDIKGIYRRGRAGEILAALQARGAVKGEITLLIGKAEEEEEARVGTGALARPGVKQRVAQIMVEEQVDEKAALKKVAKERGISKSEAYRELQRGR